MLPPPSPIAQLTALGFWGRIKPEPAARDITAYAAFRAGAGRKGTFGVQLLGDLGSVGANKALLSAPICLVSRLVAPDSLNAKSNWSVPTGGAGSMNNVAQIPNPFGGNLVGLYYTYRDTTAKFTTEGQVTTGADQGWGMQFWLHKSPAKYPFFAANWGVVVDNQAWQFRVVRGRASLVRRRPGWTQTAEDALNDLFALDSRSTGTDADIETAKALLYGAEVSFDGANLYDQALSLQIIPGYRCFWAVFQGQRILIPAPALDVNGDELPNAQAPTSGPLLWSNTKLTLHNNGGTFFWQVGYGECDLSGEVRLGRVLGVYFEDDVPSATFAVNAYLPTGTTATLQWRDAYNAHGDVLAEKELVLVLTSTNRRVTPVVYGISLIFKGGERSGTLDVEWDSESLDLSYSVILDVVTQFEGEGRRRQTTIYVRDVNGQTFANLGGNYEACEHRVASLNIKGAPYITHGLITSATIAEAKKMTPNTIRQLIMSGHTVVEIVLCDGWALLEERKVRGEWGDNKWSGAYLREMLGNLGFKTWQLAGISATAGKFHRAALPGEPFRVRPERGGFYASWFNDYLKTYLPGWTLYMDTNGVWQFKRRDKSVKAAFSTDAARHSSTTYPGRYAILSDLNFVRDTSNFCNSFDAETRGTGDNDGEVFGWEISESIEQPISTNLRTRNFIGRVREAETLSGTAIETKADATAAFLSEIEQQGNPRFANFPTRFHEMLFPGDYITCDGLVCRIARIPSGSLASDDMRYAVQEA